MYGPVLYHNCIVGRRYGSSFADTVATCLVCVGVAVVGGTWGRGEGGTPSKGVLASLHVWISGGGGGEETCQED